MKNQYDTMTLANLRELAKEKGMKNITSFKKSDLIELLVREDSVDKKEEAKNEVKAEAKVEAEEKPEAREEKKNTSAMTNQMEIQKSVVPQQKPRQTEQTPVRQSMGSRNPRSEQTQKNEQRPQSTRPQQSQRAEQGLRPEQSARIDSSSKVEQAPRAEQTVRVDQNERMDQAVRVEQVQRNDLNRNDTLPVDSTQFVPREDRKSSTANNEMDQLDSGETKVGILEVLPDGYGFIRCDNYLPGENDVYVSPAQIRRFNLKTGDIVSGNTRVRNQNEKFSALLYVKSVNGFHPAEAGKRKRFEDLTPVFPNERIHLETPGAGVSMRMVDLISPIGKGQRGMIVSQPKTGKTTLLKQIAKAVTRNHPDMKLIILLIDERPEEVTDIKESIEGRNVEVIYSTFDELPDNHKRVSEMVIERAKRLVEHKQDVIILLDSITRLARAYNLTVQPSGRTLSGGLDPAALHMPKKFFGAARNMREGGSLTILATALVDTGSRMDDVVFEEFKGTGNMELVLDRSLSEKRIFPAIDLPRSSTRREDLLLTQPEMEATYLMRKALGGMKSDDALERIIDMFFKTKTNVEFIETIKKTKIVF
ncbi:MAG: rho [Herbinix sp.]|jgi:transcription termination factor Rho|nr:rho [Herbinix sp.]